MVPLKQQTSISEHKASAKLEPNSGTRYLDLELCIRNPRSAMKKVGKESEGEEAFLLQYHNFLNSQRAIDLQFIVLYPLLTTSGRS